MSGWIKLQRDIMDHWVAQDPEYLSVWIRMLSEANFEARTIMFNGQIIKLARGELIFGLDSYHKKTKVSLMRLRRLISLLEGEKMINRVTKAKYSILSIVNYDKYQSSDTLTTVLEQPRNKQGTCRQQAQNNTIRSKELQEGKEVKKKDNSQQADESQQVFDYWCHVMGKTGNVKFTPERKNLILARLKDGYTVEHIKQAIDGCSRSDYHMARDGKNKTIYDDLTLICRNGSHVERFALNIGSGSNSSIDNIAIGYEEFMNGQH